MSWGQVSLLKELQVSRVAFTPNTKPTISHISPTFPLSSKSEISAEPFFVPSDNSRLNTRFPFYHLGLTYIHRPNDRAASMQEIPHGRHEIKIFFFHKKRKKNQKQKLFILCYYSLSVWQLRHKHSTKVSSISTLRDHRVHSGTHRSSHTQLGESLPVHIFSSSHELISLCQPLSEREFCFKILSG